MSTNESGPVTVFIAEDNPILLQGLDRALTANGYRVDTALNGRAMIELLKSSPLPDILLLDIMMPGMSGVEVLTAVRADPRTAGLPAILITAAAEEVVPGSDLKARGVDVMMKPFRLSDLLARIESLTDSRSTGAPSAPNQAPQPVPAQG